MNLFNFDGRYQLLPARRSTPHLGEMTQSLTTVDEPLLTKTRNDNLSTPIVSPVGTHCCVPCRTGYPPPLAGASCLPFAPPTCRGEITDGGERERVFQPQFAAR